MPARTLVGAPWPPILHALSLAYRFVPDEVNRLTLRQAALYLSLLEHPRGRRLVGREEAKVLQQAGREARAHWVRAQQARIGQSQRDLKRESVR